MIGFKVRKVPIHKDYNYSNEKFFRERIYYLKDKGVSAVTLQVRTPKQYYELYDNLHRMYYRGRIKGYVWITDGTGVRNAVRITL